MRWSIFDIISELERKNDPITVKVKLCQLANYFKMWSAKTSPRAPGHEFTSRQSFSKIFLFSQRLLCFLIIGTTSNSFQLRSARKYRHVIIQKPDNNTSNIKIFKKNYYNHQNACVLTDFLELYLSRSGPCTF